MKVKDIMTQSAVCCSTKTNVGAAVELMWVRNCGMLPVIGTDNKLVGVVTDRDICIAMGTRNRLAGELSISEIATRNVFTCKPDEEIHEALQTMANKHVRRLPVVNDKGILQGMLSMDDIITHGALNKWEGCSELSSEEIIRSLKQLYGQKLPVVHRKAAAAWSHRRSSFAGDPYNLSNKHRALQRGSPLMLLFLLFASLRETPVSCRLASRLLKDSSLPSASYARFFFCRYWTGS